MAKHAESLDGRPGPERTEIRVMWLVEEAARPGPHSRRREYKVRSFVDWYLTRLRSG